MLRASKVGPSERTLSHTSLVAAVVSRKLSFVRIQVARNLDASPISCRSFATLWFAWRKSDLYELTTNKTATRGLILRPPLTKKNPAEAGSLRCRWSG